MDEQDQSPLVSSSSPARPQQPRFQYQFVRDPEEEEEVEEEDDDDDFDEQLEVMERKLPAMALAPAPLLDLEDSGELPRPIAAEQPQPDRRPPVVSCFSSPPPPQEPELPAPLPPKPEPPASSPLRAHPAAAHKRRGSSSGCADETLFALPAASEPLMHSSAENVMDLQEQPGSTMSSGQEDFTAVLLDTAASLPSLSPLSADPFKEHATFDMLSDGLPARSIYNKNESEAYKETKEIARNPFLIEKNARDVPEMEYSEMEFPFTKAEAATISQTIEEKLLENSKERFNLEKISAHQHHTFPKVPVDLFGKHDEEASSEKVKYDSNDHGEKVALEENTPIREEYVDFKPFEPIWEIKDTCHGVSSLKVVVGNQIDSKLESSLDEKYDADKLQILTMQKDLENKSESSNEDLSFPSTPEAVKESSQAYITCAKFESTVTIEDNIAKTLFPLEENMSENKTDEKKIAEMNAQIGTEQNDTSIEVVERQSQEADYAKTDSLSEMSADTATNMSEGLTPDLVQEAYESEMHDATCTKLAYETKIDLVQTSESSQEPLKPVIQLCLSFEGAEAAPSPVLPDIVMEAPLNTGVAGADATAGQLEASPSEAFTPVIDYDDVKQESGKSPPYQAAVNVSLTQAQEAKEEAVLKEPDHKSSAVAEEIETPYISIACDLIKETKVSSESVSPAFIDYSKTLITECVSQHVPEHIESFEKISPQSGKTALLSGQPTSELPQKEQVVASLTVENKSVENTDKIVTDDDGKEGLTDLLHSTGKPYLESFQAEVESSITTTTLPSESAFIEIAKEKIPLQMEELSTVAYSGNMSVFKESKIVDKVHLLTKSSPVTLTEDFMTLVSTKTAPKLVTKNTDKEIFHKDESKQITNVIKAEISHLPCPELSHDLSLKNVQVEAEENIHALEKSSEVLVREVPEVSKVVLLPTDVSPLSTEKEVVSIGKPEAIEKETEREVASVKDKEKSTAIFTAKMSKSSVVDLLYWRDIKKTGVVFGASLFLLLSLTVFSIVSVTAYIALALLSVTISFRIYKGVIQAIQKSDEGHPFRAYLETDVAVSEALVQKYSNAALGHINGTVKELRRLFLVDDLVDSLKFAVLMWVFTYVGALFNGLTLLILALISLFSVPVIYERHQAQIDHYLGLVNKTARDAVTKIQAKIPGLKRKTE
ncbi:reticulon-4 isoform X1 [Trachemys scripta elegans]|uniref:reticulon-4 isoform X1 n=1 Tax=Trachemys scripta elegans TaxID=31138 RepID=UPI001557F50D|nr:reticulon-4 isoform X1 [Trachemys scripta elegans]